MPARFFRFIWHFFLLIKNNPLCFVSCFDFCAFTYYYMANVFTFVVKSFTTVYFFNSSYIFASFLIVFSFILYTFDLQVNSTFATSLRELPCLKIRLISFFSFSFKQFIEYSNNCICCFSIPTLAPNEMFDSTGCESINFIILKFT